jgi:FkbM family methyltransferase
MRYFFLNVGYKYKAMLFRTFEKHLKDRKGAIHIGANVGEERDWYKEMGFRKVIWFEPNVDLFPTLISNIKDYPGHVAYNIGVHDKLKIAKLHISNNGGQSSSLLPLGTHKRHHPKVRFIGDQIIPLTRMDEFIRDYKIYLSEFNFLNVDVQGVELNVLKSFGLLLSKLDYLYLEVNIEELYEGCALLSEVDCYVATLKFERVATHMTQHKWGDAFYVKQVSHET